MSYIVSIKFTQMIKPEATSKPLQEQLLEPSIFIIIFFFCLSILGTQYQI